MSESSIEQRLRTDVIDGLVAANGQVGFTRDDDLLTILDSLQLLRLADQVESAFGIRIDNRELTAENVGTLARLGAFVGAKLAARDAARGAGQAGARSWAGSHQHA